MDMDLFNMAAEAAVAIDDERSYLLGAVGVREDGAIVVSRNGAVHATSSKEYRTIAMAHAEARLCRKLGRNGIVYVVRIARKDGAFVLSRPCITCQMILKASHVKLVHYSIDDNKYGTFFPEENFDEINEL